MKRFVSVLALGVVALGVSVYSGANDGIRAFPQMHATDNVLYMTIHSENMPDAGRVAAYTGGQALVFDQDCPPGRCNYGLSMNFNIPGGGYRDTPFGNSGTSLIRKNINSPDNFIKVIKRLPHTHENDIPGRSADSEPGRSPLSHNFFCFQIPSETH